jgi:hypothetical protein
MNKIKTKINNKNLSNLNKVKMNLKMIKKSQILILFKMTIKTLKESEKFASMIKKYNKIAKRKVI